LPSPEEQLNSFIAKYTPEIADDVHAVLWKLRSQLPGALEVVYDNCNALAIGFSPTEKVSHVIFSIAVYPRWIKQSFWAGQANMFGDGAVPCKRPSGSS
jgi:hypothetical protein